MNEFFTIRTDYITSAFGCVDHEKGTWKDAEARARHLANFWGRSEVYVENDETKEIRTVKRGVSHA